MLLSSRIIFRDIVFIFLGTQSKDIILILFTGKISFAKIFCPSRVLAMCNKDSLEEFSFF